MNETRYWTGLADVVSDCLPMNSKGAIYRVLTYAENYEEFVHKVEEVLRKSGDRLLLIEEPEKLSSFLRHEFVSDDHEIFEMIDTATENPENVVCGEVEFYR